MQATPLHESLYGLYASASAFELKPQLDQSVNALRTPKAPNYIWGANNRKYSRKRDWRDTCRQP